MSQGVSSDQDPQTGGDSLQLQPPLSPAASMSSPGPVSQTQHPAQGCPPARVSRSVVVMIHSTFMFTILFSSGQDSKVNASLKSYKAGLPDFQQMTEASCYFGLGQRLMEFESAVCR